MTRGPPISGAGSVGGIATARSQGGWRGRRHTHSAHVQDDLLAGTPLFVGGPIGSFRPALDAQEAEQVAAMLTQAMTKAMTEPPLTNAKFGNALPYLAEGLAAVSAHLDAKEARGCGHAYAGHDQGE